MKIDRFNASHSRRNLRVESLEQRRVLSADFASFSSLSMNPTSYSSDSIIVRLADPAASLETIANTQLHAPLANLPMFRKVELGAGITVADAIAVYSSHPSVAYAEPDYAINLTIEPDDTQYDELWGLHNTGQTGGIVDIDIDAPEAWEVTQGSSSTVVAVIDTGVDYRHPDLASNIWVNSAEQDGAPGVDDDGNGYIDDIHGYDFFNRDGDPLDDHNHGTHVAGTIGAAGNNAAGVVGVNWEVQIMALKFLSAQGSGSVSGAIEAVNYAVANGASISNNSWGDYNFSLALRDAIADADEAGHIVVAAAGNGNFQGIEVDNDQFPFYPASYEVDNVISVAAIDHSGAKAGFSNYGASSVDVGAPGVSILSTLIGSGYGTFSGTSMASPHVAGVTALVRGLYPDWTHHDVIAQVVGTTDPLASLDGITVTGGRVNAATAVGNPDTVGPEVLAFAGPHPIVSGETVVDFGVTPPGTVVDRAIGVRNIGTAPLDVSGPLNLPQGFALVTGLGAATLAPGEQTSFTIRLDAIDKGVYSGPVSILTNDADESVLEFDILGEIDFIPLFKDNGDSGSSFDASSVTSIDVDSPVASTVTSGGKVRAKPVGAVIADSSSESLPAFRRVNVRKTSAPGDVTPKSTVLPGAIAWPEEKTTRSGSADKSPTRRTCTASAFNLPSALSLSCTASEPLVTVIGWPRLSQ
ncbi:S8 family serine peptidase [Pirellulales bacterium]|nr:S8 family serine peptidase [Pirellulales bacterium]